MNLALYNVTVEAVLHTDNQYSTPRGNNLENQAQYVLFREMMTTCCYVLGPIHAHTRLDVTFVIKYRNCLMMLHE
jgi:hypothetical protein